jgi:hypothetical protein
MNNKRSSAGDHSRAPNVAEIEKKQFKRRKRQRILDYCSAPTVMKYQAMAFTAREQLTMQKAVFLPYL